MTSSPPSSSLSLAVSFEFQPDRWQQRIRVALVAGLNQHFTTELTTAMAPVSRFRRHILISENFRGCQDQVRFFALHRIKPHAPPLVRAPSIHLSFNLAAVLPGGRLNALAPEATPQGTTSKSTSFTAWTTRVSILFAPHAFAPERQSSSGPPSPPVFLRSRISPLHLNSTSTDSSLPYQMQFPG